MLIRRSPHRLLLVGMLAALTFSVFASPASAITLPQNVGGIGDSLTTAWGAGGAGFDSLRYSYATGDDLRSEGLGFSHLTRLQTMSGAIAGYNIARAGTKLTVLVNPKTDSTGNPIPTQIDNLPRDVEYVTVTIGSSDVCQGARPTGFKSFRGNAPLLFSELKSRLGAANVVVLAVPNWYQLWAAFRNDAGISGKWVSTSTCPRLLGTGATDATRSQVDSYTRAYNEILATACSQANSATFRCFFARRVFDTPLTKADLSSYDGFHPSAVGQAKFSRLAWASSPYRLAQWGLHFNQAMTFARAAKNLRLNLSTAPHARVKVRVKSTTGRLLGKGSFAANGAGVVSTKLHLPGWSGQSPIRVKFTIRINDEKLVVRKRLNV